MDSPQTVKERHNHLSREILMHVCCWSTKNHTAKPVNNTTDKRLMLGRVAYHWIGIHQKGCINIKKCQRREKEKKGLYWQVKPNADKTVLPSAERIVSQHTRVNKKFWTNGTKKLFSLTRLNGGQASNAPRHIFVCLKIAHQALNIFLPFLGLFNSKNTFDSVFF